MPAVRFVALTDAARRPGALRRDEIVARFSVDGGGEARARFDDLVTFADLRRIALWPPKPRTRLLEALAASITEAPWRDQSAGLLALAERFAVTITDDAPAWRFRGVVNLRTVDRKLIKHVLGANPEREPEEALGRWQRRLGLSIDRAALRAELEAAGCAAFQQLQAQAAEQRDDTTRDPYAKLDRGPFSRCVAALAPLREAYLRAVGRAVASVSRRDQARHVHLGRTSSRMTFLSDDGLYVVTCGDGALGLDLCTAYDGVEPGERDAGPRTLRKRWRRVVHDIRCGEFPFAVHSPSAWGVGRR